MSIAITNAVSVGELGIRSPAHDIAEYLQDIVGTSIGGSASWSLFVGLEPASPDRCITVYDTPGVPAVPDANHYEPSVQVRVRGVDYRDVYEKAVEIRQWLIVPRTREIDERRYVGVWPEGDISSLGRDENNRHRLVATYRIIREEG